MKNGFTLVEVLVSISIIGILSVVILLNYRTGQNQASLTRSAAALETSIRNAQDLAASASEFGGSIPCGYGLRYVDSRNYSLYAGAADAANCQASNHNFQAGTDAVYEDAKIIEPRVVFKNSFPDIFFEPPDPATYINNNRSIGVSTVIDLCLESDPSVCRSLTVDTAGRISIQ